MEATLIESILKVEDRHWWFQGRRRIVLHVLQRFIENKKGQVLEIGCGSGANFEVLSQFGELYAVEMDETSRNAANQRNSTQVHNGHLPDGINLSESSFDLVALLDVLEHIKEDKTALVAVSKLLNPGGCLIVTVPAFQFLWSHHDELNHHFRRYTKGCLNSLLREAGLTLLYTTYANFFLFPLMLAHRLLGNLLPRKKNANIHVPPPPVNRVLQAIFSRERHLMPTISYPFGSSVLALAQKQA